MAEKRFTLFHFNMVPIRQLDIETLAGLSREEWMRTVLSEPFEFQHRKNIKLYWTPGGELGECFYGLIQKKAPHTLHRSPKEGGEEFVTEEWQGSYVIIDPTSHEEGQRIAVENDVVGRPTAIMKKLRRSINERADAPFQIEIEPIFDANTFWSFAYLHGGVLKSVSFDFVVPNMWGTETDLEKELQNTRDDTGAERVRIGLESHHGVDVDSERIKNGVGYAEKGAGKINAKSLEGDSYSSETEPRTTRIKVIDQVQGLAKDFLREMRNSILGRE